MKWIILLLIFYSSTALALDNQLWLDLNIGSKHSRDFWYEDVLCDQNWENCHGGTIEPYNEFNPGAGLSYGITDYLDLMAGFVSKNSYDKFSGYGGANLKLPIKFHKNFRLEPGIIFTLASGYEDSPVRRNTIAGLFPSGFLNITAVMFDRVYARVGYFPDIDGKPSHEFEDGDRAGVLILQAGIRIK